MRTDDFRKNEPSAYESEYMRATGRSLEELREADRLWNETGGVISDAHVRALNEKAVREHEPPRYGAAFGGMREVRTARG